MRKAVLAVVLGLLMASMAFASSVTRVVYTGLEFLGIAEVPNVVDLSGGGAFWYPIPEVVLRHGRNLWVVDLLNKQYKNTTIASTGGSAGIWVCASGGVVEDYGYWYIERPNYYTNILRFLDREFNELANYTFDFPAIEPAGIGDNVIFLSATIIGSYTDYFMAVRITCTPEFSITVRRVALTLPFGFEFVGRPLAMGYSPTLLFAIVNNWVSGYFGLAYTVVSDIMSVTSVELSHFTVLDYGYGIPLYGYINGTAVIGYARGFEVIKYIINLNTLTYETVRMPTNLPLPDSNSDRGLVGVITEGWLAYHSFYYGETGVFFVDPKVCMRLPWYNVVHNIYSLGATYKYNATPAVKIEFVSGRVVLKAGVLLLHAVPPTVTGTGISTETITSTTTITKVSTTTTTEVVPIPVVRTVTETITTTTTVGGVTVEYPTLLLILLVLGVALAILVATRRY